VGKLTLTEFEAIDRIKIDALISLLIDSEIINKNDFSIMVRDKISNLADCDGKEKIKVEINKFLKSV